MTPWDGNGAGPAIYDASSGDFVITPLPGGGNIRGVQFNADLTDVSIRTQVRLLGPGGAISVDVRCSGTDGYGALLSTNGVLQLVDLGLSLPAAELGSVTVPFDVSQEDVILQLDIVDELTPSTTRRGVEVLVRTGVLSVWAWRPSEPMPSAPLITAMHSAYERGAVGLFTVGGGLNVPGAVGPAKPAVFRFVDVTIPEPFSTPRLVSVMGGLGPAPDTFISPLSPDAPLSEITLEADEPVTLDRSTSTYSGSGPAPQVVKLRDTGDGSHHLVLDSPVEPGQWLRLELDVTSTTATATFTLWLAHHPGDINQDGTVDVRDATAFGDLFRDGGSPVLVDLNDDGLVDMRDATTFGEIWHGTDTTQP